MVAAEALTGGESGTGYPAAGDRLVDGKQHGLRRSERLKLDEYGEAAFVTGRGAANARITFDDQFNSLGEIPQDKKYAGEPTRLEIGDNNTIREFCTFNLGTIQDGGLTSIGDDNWIMAYVHIAHDCHVGNHTIMANGVTLAGHVRIDDWVIIGGLTGVHQFVRIGAHAMTGFQSRISRCTALFHRGG